MGNAITATLPRPPEAILAEALKRVEDNGGKLTGNAAAGTFVVRGVHGNYQIKGKELTVIVMEKPFYMPMVLVESIVRSQMKDICMPMQV